MLDLEDLRAFTRDLMARAERDLGTRLDWVAVDHSSGPTRGNVYMLASVDRSSNADPLDVMFARSTDGGATWSPANTGLSGTAIYTVAVDAQDPQHAMAAGASGVYRSDDGGAIPKERRLADKKAGSFSSALFFM